MNEKKRIAVMVVALVILIAVNLYFRWSKGDAEGSAFWSERTGEIPSVPARLQKTLALLQRIPSLSFQAKNDLTPSASRTPDQRNPFIFGVNRRLEAERRERMVALEQARTELENTRQEAQQAIGEPAPPVFEGEILGVLESRVNGEKTVSLLLDGEIIVLNLGDTLKHRLRLVALDYRRIIFQRLEDGEKIEVKLDSNSWE